MISTINQPTTKDLRSFGLLMGGVFLIVAVWPLVIHGESIRVWASLFAGAFGAMGLIFPKGLKPMHRVWMKIGEKLGWINSRIILSLLFFGMFTPMAFVMGLLGKRPLQLGYDPKANSYRVVKKARAADHVLKPF
ncbi:SxtJ family membrane protein [Candidatus Nitrospira allomarina]|jgi:saxitoxin biosynthesis operon SxtJ-like protein|uniref:SxtJ family membrane protein n=1 Tax=Candidatus Nitrospira allomarina TaxID=3020900 RepID=A0AA96GF92_9BACT|nr:SxtJ family membrane protein [Candidatus Nitrospira allomarina]WNM58985.1 SxtJ family membrane protein [Candidatus Nitrospira allomarina]